MLSRFFGIVKGFLKLTTVLKDLQEFLRESYHSERSLKDFSPILQVLVASHTILWILERSLGILGRFLRDSWDPARLIRDFVRFIVGFLRA